MTAGIAHLQHRLFGGAHRIHWRGADIARLCRFYSVPEAEAVLLTRREAMNSSVSVPAVESDGASGDGTAYRFKMSGPEIDHYGDSVSLEWDLSMFRRNAPALWAHDSSLLPIGRWTNVGVRGGALRGEWIPGGTPIAKAARREVESGNLRACSVGFIPGDWEFSKRNDGGINFLRGHKLLETSLCAVPALSSALYEGVSPAKSIDSEHERYRARAKYLRLKVPPLGAKI